jgi:hypothetical protein
VVVRVPDVGLEQVVVHALGRTLRAHPVQPQGLEFQHGEGPGGVLEQGVVDAAGDFFGGGERTLHEVTREDLLRQVSRFPHGHPTSPAV